MATSKQKALQQINIHLAKSDITTFAKVIADRKSPTRLASKASVLPDGALYYEAPPATQASWRAFLAPGFGASLPAFNTQHASAVLLFKAGSVRHKRIFAVTFGYGRSLLADSALEPDFGLRTALNLCNPETLQAVDYRTIEERTRIGRIQLSDSGSVDAFRMNIDTDLLRGLEAESKDNSICERLGARWANLIVTARAEIGDLPALATNLLKHYRKRTLPTEYAWIDNVRRVTDPTRIRLLDAELESRVAKGEFEGIRLAIPEIAGTTIGHEVRLFSPKLEAAAFTSDFAAYLDMRKRHGEWKVDTAKASHKAYIVDSATGKELQHSSLYRCIVAEFDLSKDRYLLVDGEWFQLDRSFVDDVNRAVSSIPLLKHKLPLWNNGENESDWNARACKAWREAALLDKSNILHGGGRSRVEPADFLTAGHVFGHVKRRDKSSSGLSHLFAQGVVAGRLIYQDAAFRRKVANVIPTSHKEVATQLKGTLDPRKWTIGYVILGADSKRPANTLPFFSKVNLKGAVEQLRLMSYKVGIIGV